MEIIWTKKSPVSFDLERSDGVVLARCINDRGTVVGFVYNAMPKHKMRPIANELFDFMDQAMGWCNSQLTSPTNSIA